MRSVIDVGSKLRKSDAPSIVIEVTALLTSSNSLPHARARVSFAHRNLGERVYAVSALEDPRLFLPVGGSVSQHTSV